LVQQDGEFDKYFESPGELRNRTIKQDFIWVWGMGGTWDFPLKLRIPKNYMY